MIAVRCPKCGRPSPIFLGRPDVLRCPGCGYLGPPPQESVGALHHVARVLAGIDQRERQLTVAQRRTLLLGRRNAGCFTCVALLLGAPFGCMTLFTILDLARGTAEVSDILFGVIPILAFLTAVGVLGLWTRVARGALERAAVAYPPAAPGEPAACHTCGGPVPVGGAEPLVRCAYCGADNLVTAKALEKAGARRDLVLDAWEVDIERQGRAAAATNRNATALLLPAAVVLPATMFLVGAALLLSIERPADEKGEYTERTTASGQRCVSRVLRDSAGVRLDWHYSAPPGETETAVVAPPGVVTFSATKVIGRDVFVRRTGEMGRVVRVYTTMLSEHSNELELVSPKGTHSTQSLAGSCFDPPPAGADGDGGTSDARAPAGDAATDGGAPSRPASSDGSR